MSAAASSPAGWLRYSLSLSTSRTTARVRSVDLTTVLDALDMALDAAMSAKRAGVPLDPDTVLAALAEAIGDAP